MPGGECDDAARASVLIDPGENTRLLARQGYADAQYNLGALYYNGRGVAKDYVRAYLWKSLAADGTVTTVPQRRARAGRDAIGAVMSQSQLAEARALIAACQASDFEGCE